LLIESLVMQSYKQLKTRVNTNRRIGEFWQILLGRYPQTQMCCSSHKCMFLTNVAPFKREINRLSNGIRFIAKKHCYNKEIIYLTQISLLFVLCLHTYIHTYIHTPTLHKHSTH